MKGSVLSRPARPNAAPPPPTPCSTYIAARRRDGSSKVRTPVRACTSQLVVFNKAAAGCEGERDGINKRLRVRNLALT